MLAQGLSEMKNRDILLLHEPHGGPPAVDEDDGSSCSSSSGFLYFSGGALMRGMPFNTLSLDSQRSPSSSGSFIAALSEGFSTGDPLVRTAIACERLFDRLVCGIAGLAQTTGGRSGKPLGQLRPHVLSGITSHLARLGYHDKIFFKQAADEVIGNQIVYARPLLLR